jgi:hypothetical protein
MTVYYYNPTQEEEAGESRVPSLAEQHSKDPVSQKRINKNK